MRCDYKYITTILHMRMLFFSRRIHNIPPSLSEPRSAPRTLGVGNDIDVGITECKYNMRQLEGWAMRRVLAVM